MNLHEYQSKELFRQAGIPVPPGQAIFSPDQAGSATEAVMGQSQQPIVVVKAQVHAGGRGKGRFIEHPDLGGVVVVTEGIQEGADAAKSRVAQLAEAMLGSTLVTAQTGPNGQTVHRVYLEAGLEIATELYLSILVDRSLSQLVMVGSTAGGMEIETVADQTPELIERLEIDSAFGLLPFQAREMAHRLGTTGSAHRSMVGLLEKLTQFVQRWDTSLCEINPLVVTNDEQVIPLDAKVTIDDNALFRYPQLAEMVDPAETEPTEQAAQAVGLSYIKLDGNIGCMVNGAGLAMSTMDIIKHVGGEPANFLDVGGGANAEQVATAFELITRDPEVRGIFVNIFGGIMRCDTIATGILEAVQKVGLSVPLVVRLEGTNVELGRQILDQSELNVVTASDMKAGAQQIVELVGTE